MKRKAENEFSDSEDEDLLNYSHENNGKDGENQLEVVIRAREVRRELSERNDFRSNSLKQNHEEMPLWVCPNGQVFLETFNEAFDVVSEFLIAISEPVSRPINVHHYKITPYSLYAAVSVDLSTENILEILQKYNKFEYLAPEVEKFIVKCTNSYGKAKLVLKNSSWLVESQHPRILKELLTDPKIQEARLWPKELEKSEFLAVNVAVKTEKVDAKMKDIQSKLAESLARRIEKAEELDADEDKNTSDEALIKVEDENPFKIRIKLKKSSDREVDIESDEIKKKLFESDHEFRKDHKVSSFEIDSDRIEQVKESAIRMNYPLMEEYDFRRDKRNVDLGILLTGKLRSYQEKAMQKMFKNGRARSGLIVLPCGAGKTLTGITANCTINKSSLILCTSAVAVEQWIRSYLQFTTCKQETIVRFTKDSKHSLNMSGKNILVTTYYMMSYSKKRNVESARIINQIKNVEWGLLVMDEVHVVPAKMFRKALVNVKAHCKLGLTATLVREDDLIDDLNFLIGPKLYEANWMKLTSMGFLARVLCAEVWCPMTSEFYKEYLQETNAKRRQLLYVMNPIKFATAKLLMQYHEKQGDKVLLFSDNIPALLQYGRKLKRYFMYGNTPEREREWLLARFRLPAHCSSNSPQMIALREKFGHLFRDNFTPINTLIISQVGDVAIDLPEANIIIQISSHFGSRRQEAQRLGRILRPKSNAKFKVGFNAFFYSLLSMDTTEMFYSTKRQQYLVDQGYTFKVIRNLKQVATEEMGLEFDEEPSRAEQREMLNKLTTDVSNIDEELNIGVEDLVNRRNFGGTEESLHLKKKKKVGTNPLMKLMKKVRV